MTYRWSADQLCQQACLYCSNYILISHDYPTKYLIEYPNDIAILCCLYNIVAPINQLRWWTIIFSFKMQWSGAINLHLVGGLEYLSIYWECHHPNWRTPSFFKGVGQPPTRDPGMYYNDLTVMSLEYTGMIVRFAEHHHHMAVTFSDVQVTKSVAMNLGLYPLVN